MDSFAELIRGINKGRRLSVNTLPSTDPLSKDSITDIRNAAKADKVLESAAAKSEKAFNSALNSYFKKFGLKYKNGKVTSPSVDRALERMAKKAQANNVSPQTLNAIIRVLSNNAATGASTTIPGTQIPNTDPLSSGSSTDIRNSDIRNILGK